MKLLVYEYCCATGLGRSPVDPAHSLFREGLAMRNSLAEDFAQVPGVSVLTLDGNTVEAEPDEFQSRIQQADAAVVIAPEFDDLLADRVEWVRHAGRFALNCSREAIHLCADKSELAQHWESRGIRTPQTRLAGDEPQNWPCVWKPRFGAGSTATRLLQNTSEAAEYHHDFASEPLARCRVEQEFIRGLPCSLSFLCGPAGLLPLTASCQQLSRDGRFQYQGGWLPLPLEWQQRAERVAQAALAEIPGLLGYVGVDLLLGDTADGRADFAIEINPRLTTSYLGLRALSQVNLAEQMWAIAQGKTPSPFAWNSGPIAFDNHGPISDIVNIL